MFANRVRKNARHLGKWAKRESDHVLARLRPRHPRGADHGRHLRGRARHQRLPHRPERRARGSTTLAAAARSALDASEVFVKRRERLSTAARAISTSGSSTQRRVAHGARGRPRSFASTSATTSTPGCSSITASRARGSPPSPAQTMLNLFATPARSRSTRAAAGMQTTTRRSVEHVPRMGAREPRAQPARRRDRARRRARVPRRGAARGPALGPRGRRSADVLELQADGLHVGRPARPRGAARRRASR